MTIKKGPLASATKSLEVTAHEVIRTFMSARIDFSGGCVDQCAIDVKGPQGTILIEGHTGLNSFQRMFGHEKRSFHRAIISPEPYSSPRGVVTATIIWKTQDQWTHLFHFEVTMLLASCLVVRLTECCGVRLPPAVKQECQEKYPAGPHVEFRPIKSPYLRSRAS